MRPTPVLLTLGLALAASAPAAGDGLPINGPEVGPAGVALPGAPAERVVALPGPRSTTVARVRRDGGQIARWRQLRGTWTVPAVALDGTVGGLTRDGARLVLIRPRRSFPQRSTSFAVVSTASLQLVRRIMLRGDFSFDALSPDGLTMYLVQYTSRRDPTRYLVRAFDLRSGRLRPGAIVDPGESPDEMRGFALTRASTADGRWAYTLYDGGGGHPFVHALDTVAGRAVCIDLDPLEGRAVSELSRLRLHVAATGGHFDVVGPSGPVVVVDTTSFAVRQVPPSAAGAAAPAERGTPATAEIASERSRPGAASSPEGGAGGGPPTWAWPLGLLAAVVLAGATVAGVRSRNAPRPGG